MSKVNSKNYVDAKVTIWQRYHFSEDADMDKIKEIIAAGGDFVDDDLGFKEAEDLCETIEGIEVGYIERGPVIEVYKNDERIYKGETNEYGN